MPKYRVFLNGENFVINTERGPRRKGFYQTHWIEADDEKKAELAAAQRVRENEDLRIVTLNKGKDAPRIFLEEIAEVANFDHVIANPEGLLFYADVRWWQFWRIELWESLWDLWTLRRISEDDDTEGGDLRDSRE